MSAGLRPTAGFARFATLHQLRVCADHDGEFWLRGFSPFETSGAVTCEELIAGDWHNLPVRIARFRYRRVLYESTRKQQPRIEQFAAAVATVPLESPRIAISNRWFTEACGKIFGFGSLPVTTERFISHLQVEADRSDYAEQVLDTPMVEWLRTIPDVCLELDHGHVLVARQGTIGTEALSALLGVLEGFVSRIPGRVWSTYGIAPNRNASAA